MDSTSLSFPIASSDALMSTVVVVSKDDGSLSIASGLAKESGMLFQAGKYVDCLRVLNQLLQRKEDDPNVVIVENQSYHKYCFKCSHGGCPLSPSNYAALDGILYCKPHFSQLFKEKGSYNHLIKYASMKCPTATV